MVDPKVRLAQKAKAQKKYRLSEKGRIAQKKYYQSDVKNKSSKKWREKPENKIKRIAHVAVAHARKIAGLARQPCAICGKPNALAHHEDYNKPLEIMWLCTVHHTAWHKKEIGGDVVVPTMFLG